MNASRHSATPASPRELAPCLVDADDDALAIEDRDLRGERGEDGPVQLLARTHRARRARPGHRAGDELTRGAQPCRRAAVDHSLPDARPEERQRADRDAVGDERNLELAPPPFDRGSPRRPGMRTDADAVGRPGHRQRGTRRAVRILDEHRPARPRVAADARQRILEGRNLLFRRMAHRVGGEIGDRLLVRHLLLDRELRAPAPLALHQQQRDEHRLERDQPHRRRGSRRGSAPTCPACGRSTSASRLAADSRRAPSA